MPLNATGFVDVKAGDWMAALDSVSLDSSGQSLASTLVRMTPACAFRPPSLLLTSVPLRLL
jgi:hypothetical protein